MWDVEEDFARVLYVDLGEGIRVKVQGGGDYDPDVHWHVEVLDG